MNSFEINAKDFILPSFSSTNQVTGFCLIETTPSNISIIVTPTQRINSSDILILTYSHEKSQKKLNCL